jgi:glycine/D-amino acid oxidase-like deaminating enzyme
VKIQNLVTMMTAASGLLVSQLILDGKADMDLAPFAVGRKPYDLQPPWWSKLTQ